LGINVLKEKRLLGINVLKEKRLLGINVLKEKCGTLLGFFGAPCDSAPEALCPLVPVITPLV